MAESVKVVDPDLGSGYDYDSLFDWEAAQQADIDTSNTIAVAKCRCTGGSADVTLFTIDGWTSSATDYIKIWTDTSETYRHSGVWSDSKVRLVYSHAGLPFIKILENYVRIDGLQISNPNTASNGQGGIWYNTADAAGKLIVTNCIIKGPPTAAGDNSGITVTVATGATAVFVNNIVYDWAFCGILDADGTSGTIFYLYNNTIVSNGTHGFRSFGNASAIILYNNLIQGSSDKNYSLDSCTAITSAANISEDTSSPNAALRSIVIDFLLEASDDYHLASTDTDAIGAGTNLYNDAVYPFQTDIDGQDRGGAAAAWDIGADEYVSAVTNLSIFASECVGSEGVFG